MKYKLFLFLLITVFFNQATYAQNKQFTVSGQIKDTKNGEDLISVTVFIPELEIGTITNSYGFYSLTLEEGTHELLVSYLGFAEQKVTIHLTSNQTMNFELGEDAAVLGEVVVSAEKENKDRNISSSEMSVDAVKIKSIKAIPALLGEVDVLKYIQLLPGVKSAGEGTSGFHVRGGNLDQNLILLDEAPIYNASHLLGFFSAFNPDAVKDMQLFKGGFPANYGGRLSSVLDIRMKEGNSKKFTANGGIGLLMSRLAIEAPLGKNGSFMVAGRRSYIDVVAKTFKKIKGDKEDAELDIFFFRDFNAKANYRINAKNRIFASGYFGRDFIDQKEEEEEDESLRLKIDWGNTTGTLRWNHLFSPKLFSNLTYYYSNYDYFLDFSAINFKVKWKALLREHSLKADFGAYLSPKNELRFGAQLIQHEIQPGDVESADITNDLIGEFKIQKNKSYESAIYINNKIDISNKLKINYGLRFSMLQNVGPHDAYTLDDEFNVIDTTSHKKGIYNTYKNLEPRVNIRYRLTQNKSLKASYTRTAQYIQLASTGNSSSPFDIWFSSSNLIKPQLADQVVLGYYQNLKNNDYEFSAEVYFKKFYNSIDFRDHASLFFNAQLETELRIGRSRAYGIELVAKKKEGKLTGWISYSYSKAEKKIETINDFKWYNARFDKPHNLTLVASYHLNKRVAFGTNFIYSTGSPGTYATGTYNFFGTSVPLYSERNGARLPHYHRLDASLTLQGKKNKFRRLQTEWVFSIYNLYNRKNAFAINFKENKNNGGLRYAEKSAIFGIVPAFTFNCKF